MTHTGQLPEHDLIDDDDDGCVSKRTAFPN